MTKNPVSVDKNILAAKALAIMNSKKSHLCVFMIIKIKIKP